MGKLGFYLPRTISAAVSQRDEPESFHIHEHAIEGEHTLAVPFCNQSGAVTPNSGTVSPPSRPLFRIGRTVIRYKESRSTNPTPGDSPTGARTPVTVSQTTPNSQSHNALASPRPESFQGESQVSTSLPPLMGQRAIRFPDETIPGNQEQ